MKKTLCVLLAFMMIMLCSCSKKAPTNDAPKNDAPKIDDRIIEEADIEQITEFSITPDDLLKEMNLNEDYLPVISATKGNTTYTMTGHKWGAQRIMILSNAENNNVLAFYVEVKNTIKKLDGIAASFTNAIVACGAEEGTSPSEINGLFMKSGWTDVNTGSVKLWVDRGSETNRFLAYPNGINNPEEFHARFEWGEVCFFNEKEDVDNFKEIIEKYDYNGAIKLLQKYISENNPPEYDVSYMLLDLLYNEQALQALSKCKIKTDKVTDTTYVYYKNLNKISSNINLFAYLEGPYDSYKIGFKANKWLFFEEVTIKADNTIINQFFNYYDVERNVIGGGIEEYVSTDFKDEEIDAIINAKEVIIRFSDETGEKYIDHTLSADEIESIRCMKYLSDTRLPIVFLCNNWYNVYA